MFLAFVAAASVAAAGSATPAAATPAPTAAATAARAAKAKDPSSETVCWFEAPVGSHLPKRYCASRAYLENRTREDQQGISPFYRGGPGGGGGGGGLSAGPGGQGGSDH